MDNRWYLSTPAILIVSFGAMLWGGYWLFETLLLAEEWRVFRVLMGAGLIGGGFANLWVLRKRLQLRKLIELLRSFRDH